MRFEINPNVSVIVLKQQIYDQVGVDPMEQCLKNGNIILSTNCKPLSNYIDVSCKEAFLQLVVYGKAGGPVRPDKQQKQNDINHMQWNNYNYPYKKNNGNTTITFGEPSRPKKRRKLKHHLSTTQLHTPLNKTTTSYSSYNFTSGFMNNTNNLLSSTVSTTGNAKSKQVQQKTYKAQINQCFLTDSKIDEDDEDIDLCQTMSQTMHNIFDSEPLLLETDAPNFISLAKAINDSLFPNYECSQIDQLIYEKLLTNNQCVFKVSDKWIIFCDYDSKKNKILFGNLLNVSKIDGRWTCDKKCKQFNAAKFSNELADDDKSPLCIHGILSHLIIEKDNPTHITYHNITQDHLICNEPLIYSIKTVNNGQKIWKFAMDKLGVSYG
eukprot:491634_1